MYTPAGGQPEAGIVYPEAHPKFDLNDWIHPSDRQLPPIIVKLRHLAIMILLGSIIMFIGDLCPFMFIFKLSFEYWCLFYPAIVTFLYSVIACIVFFRRDFEAQGGGGRPEYMRNGSGASELLSYLPFLRLAGFITLLFCFLQLIFTIIGTAMFHSNTIIVGGVFFNPFVLIFLVMRFWCLIQIIVILLIDGDARLILREPSILRKRTSPPSAYHTGDEESGIVAWIETKFNALGNLFRRRRADAAEQAAAARNQPPSEHAQPYMPLSHGGGAPGSDIYAPGSSVTAGGMPIQPFISNIPAASSKMILESKEETV